DGTGEIPLGAMNTPGIGNVPFNAALDSYDPFIQAMGVVRAANEVPGAAIMSSRSQTDLDRLTDTTGQPLQAPAAYAGLNRFFTNAIANNGGTGTNESTGIVANFGQGAFGIRNEGMMEITRVANDAFKNLQVMIRLYMRADYHVLRNGAF